MKSDTIMHVKLDTIKDIERKDVTIELVWPTLNRT